MNFESFPVSSANSLTYLQVWVCRKVSSKQSFRQLTTE